MAKFGGALLGSIGLGSLVNLLRRRSARKQRAQQEEQQAQQEAERRREIERLSGMAHEIGDVRPNRIALVALALVVVVVAAYLALGGLFAYLADRAASEDAAVPPLARTAQIPSEPRLQVAPPEDLAQMRATEQARLGSYGWVDQNANVAHIPIERAMELIAQRGLPTAGTAQSGAVPQPTGAPGAGRNVPASTPARGPTSATPVGGGASGNAAEGEQLFASLGCASCHVMDGSGVGPSLRGVFGSQVQLEGAGSVTADEAYIRESILNPTAKVVAGRQPVMPSFQGRVDDAQLAALVAYIQSLGQ
jgi:mono/diheme cytochrome c family protein